jgi:hypothetical protein
MPRSQRRLRYEKGIDSSFLTAYENDERSRIAPAEQRTRARVVRPNTMPAAVTLPVNTALPTITGTAQVGATLTATFGTWTGARVVLTGVWLRGTVPILRASALTYSPVPADVGQVLRFRVTGTNIAGAVSVDSAPTAAVLAA